MDGVFGPSKCSSFSLMDECIQSFILKNSYETYLRRSSVCIPCGEFQSLQSIASAVVKQVSAVGKTKQFKNIRLSEIGIDATVFNNGMIGYYSDSGLSRVVSYMD